MDANKNILDSRLRVLFAGKEILHNRFDLWYYQICCHQIDEY